MEQMILGGAVFVLGGIVIVGELITERVGSAALMLLILGVFGLAASLK